MPISMWINFLFGCTLLGLSAKYLFFNPIMVYLEGWRKGFPYFSSLIFIVLSFIAIGFILGDLSFSKPLWGFDALVVPG